MRNSFIRHRAKGFAIVSAAAGLAASVQLASAETWVNPITGNWSVGANWVGGVAPASGASTALRFNAVGAETYTATNDIATPFVLNSITFNNGGTGQINLAGAQLSFGGVTPAINILGSGAQSIGNPIEIQSLNIDQTTMSVTGNGGGALNLTGALSSNVASTGTFGGAMLLDTTSSVNVSGGGSLYGIAVNNGSLNFTGGTYTFTSTERGNDAVGAVNDGGHFGVAVGHAAGQTGRVTVNGATINTNSFMVGDGGTGIGTISGGTITMPITGNVFFGVNQTGTLLVNNGSRVTTNFAEFGRQLTGNANVTLDGANTRVDAMQVVERGIAHSTISNGALLNVGTGNGNGNTFFPTGNGSTGTLLISSGGQLTQGNQMTVGAGTNSTGNVTISSGGKWISTAGNAFFASSSAGPGATATITVTDAGSSLQALRPAAAGGQISLGSNGTATLNVLNAGTTQSNTMFTAVNSNGRAFMNVDGANSVVMNNDVIVASGGGTNAGQSTINVTNGGAIRSQRLTFGQNAFGITSVTATGASTITTQGVGAGTGSWASGLGSVEAVATINIQNGAFAGSGGAFFLSGGVGTNNGGNTVFNVNNAQAQANFLQIGQNNLGQGTFNIVNAGSVQVNTNTIVGLNSTGAGTMNINGAGSQLTTPSLVGAFNSTGPLGDPIPGGFGWINVTGAGQVNTTGLGVTIASGQESNATMIVSGPGSNVTSTGTAQLVVGSNGNGTLTVENGGAMTMPGNGFFGAGTTSQSQTLISGGTLAMGNQMQIGGSGGNANGPSTFTVNSNGAASSGDLTTVYSTGTLIVGTGTSPGRYTSGGDMGVDGNVFYNAGSLSAVGTLDVAGNVLLSSANRNATGTPSNKKLLEAGQATLTASGVIDLNDNDMLIHHNDKARYENFIKLARNNGAWDQPGITSTAAKNASPQNRNLGVLSGTEYLAVNGTPFNGKTVVATDTVIKFTFNGDTDFNGVVNFDDYARVDGGFNNGRSGWLNGDFDYNGIVNFDDYSLIDGAFNTQGAVVLAAGGELAGPGFNRAIERVQLHGVAALGQTQGIALSNGDVALAEQAIGESGALNGGNLNAVPEPATLSIIGLAMLGATRRRRRQALA